MLLRFRPSRLHAAFALLASAAIFAAPACFGPAQAAETVLYSFAGGADGRGANSSFGSDTQGTLYVITKDGGSYGQGTIFKLTPPVMSGQTKWTKSLLYTFQGKLDGGSPGGIPAFDTNGAIYGTTTAGGSSNAGVVYKLTPPWVSGQSGWTENVLYSFPISFNGSNKSGLIFDTQGALYGVTSAGGTSNAGTVYKLTPGSGASQWNNTVLYSFKGLADGGHPGARPIFDTQGALYGTTRSGGNLHYGAVFKLTPPPTPGTGQWTEAVLYSFKGGADGFGNGRLIFDPQGALYGEGSPTDFSGTTVGNATVFKLAPPPSGTAPWVETVLSSPGGPAGFGGLIFDTQGDLYSTMPLGGSSNAGAVFRLTPPAAGKTQWTISVLYSFQGQSDGAMPAAGLIFGPGGVLYGIASGGGTSGNGTIFQVSRPSCP